MLLDNSLIIKRIDDALQKSANHIRSAKYNDLSDLGENIQTETVTATLLAAIENYAPPESSFIRRAKACQVFFPLNAHKALKPLHGVLQSLRDAYDQGYLQTINELVHADIFSDFLEMAEHLLDQGYKDPGAVIVGSVLEEHLRKLAAKGGVAILQANGSPKKSDSINAELSTMQTYSKLDQKSITSWLDLRNKAAHGNYAEYEKEQVAIMLAGVRNFVSRCPA